MMSHCFLKSTACILMGLSSCLGLQASELSATEKVLFEVLIQAQEDMNDCTSGQGKAMMKGLTAQGNRKENLIEFMFKDDHSRADLYAVDDGVQGEREIVFVRAPDGSNLRYRKPVVEINQQRSCFDANSGVAFISTLGYNFHPKAFHQSYGSRFSEVLLRSLNRYPERFHIAIDRASMLCVEYDHQWEHGHTRRTWTFDPLIEYRLVCTTCVREMFSGLHPSNSSRFSELKWNQFGQQTYISSVKCIWYEGLYSTSEAAALAGAMVERFRELKILEFDPLAPVDDSDFELGGLDLPVDTRVRTSEIRGEFTGP